MANKLLQRLSVSAGLSALFLVVYGGCNWITAQRGDVGSIFFEWERQIPFVPLLIAPYLSIDLFFVLAPFLCRGERELSVLAKRIATAIMVAGVCFLAFPFRFAFVRPQTSGWLGGVFDWFRTMDAPFNLFPSLHVALAALLAATYLRHTKGLLRCGLAVWFALIVASAVLTYQHHFLDVVGGFALAGYCFFFFRETPRTQPGKPAPRIALYYATGGFVLLGAVIAWWPWGALLLWPVTALGIVAGAYFRFGPSIYRKALGRIPWSSYWALGPVIAGQHLSRLYYRRRCSAWNTVTANVWIGAALSGREARVAVDAGVTSVLDLTAESSAPHAFRRLRYLNIPILDLTAPTTSQLEGMASFIATEAERGVVYVHCKIGYSRSAGAVAAYLLSTGRGADLEKSLSQLRAARPSIVVRPEVREALIQFAEHNRQNFVLASNDPGRL